jgi:hypothetical protein
MKTPWNPAGQESARGYDMNFMFEIPRWITKFGPISPDIEVF